MPPRHNKTPPSRRDSPASQREKDAETFGSSPSHAKRLLATALEDCEFRFIMNLPESELKSPERLFFQIEQVRGTVVGLRHCAFGTGTVFERRSRERFTRPFLPYHPFQAHWYYEDFLADAPNSGLPHISSLKQFGQKLFAHSDVLDPDLFDDCFANFMAYKGQIPTYGCILVNPNMTHMLLVRNWKGTSWGFPKGKLNEGEDGATCAAREVCPPPNKKNLSASRALVCPTRCRQRSPSSFYRTTTLALVKVEEEIGYRPSVVEDESCTVVLEGGQRCKMFIVGNAPEDFPYEHVARKEISKVWPS